MSLTQIKTSNIDNSGSGLNFRNRIINGDMRIDQRNAGASVTPTDGQYTLDRYQASLNVPSKFSIQRSTVAPSGFVNSLLVTSLSAYSLGAGEVTGVVQKVEGFNVADLGWGTANARTVTLSFWVRSSLTGTFGGSFRNGAANRSYPFAYTISTADTWEQKSVTLAGDTSGSWLTDNGVGVQLYFAFGAGATYSGTAGSWQAGNFISATGATSVVGTSGATFYITGVQLEEGTSATAFERRPYGTELALCQRYYETSYYNAVAPSVGTSGAHIFYPHATTSYASTNVFWAVSKRTQPTMTVYSGFTGLNSGKIGNYDNGTTEYNAGASPRGIHSGFVYVSNASVSQSVGLGFQWIVSAEL